MVTVTIANVSPWPPGEQDGRSAVAAFLVVLAEEAGRRVLPVWLTVGPGAHSLQDLAGQTDDIVTAGAPEELGARLLQAAGAEVTGVDIEADDSVDALTQQAGRARIHVSGPAGRRHVTAGLGLGLAMAAAAGAPVRVPGPVMDALAEPVPGDDVLAPFAGRVPPAGRQPDGCDREPWPLASLPAQRPRFQPRNLGFADGLDRWDLDGGFLREPGSAQPDYAAAADGGTAVLWAAVPEPRGSAVLVQTVFADDYRGSAVIFRAQIRTEAVTDQAGLRLEILRRGREPVREDHVVTVNGCSGWARHQITARVPEDANVLRFGVGLTGPGLVALRDADLARGA